MSRKILVNYDFNKNEIQNVRTQNLASAPGSPVTGQRYYDTVNLSEYFWNGTGWIPVDATLRTGIPNANLATNPLARANHTGTQLAATISDFATATRAVTAFPIGNLTTDPLARANHTGTQLSATISDLATTVQAYKLNQFAAPNANIPMAGFKFTGLATPTTSGDSAEYTWVLNQVQASAAGLDVKTPVACVATAQRALTGLTAIDGYTPVAGDRVLLAGQTTASENGIYVAAAGAWARSTDCNSAATYLPSSFCMVLNGTTYGGSQWKATTPGTDTGGVWAYTIGTTSITWTQFGGANPYSAGNGLQLVGQTFSLPCLHNFPGVL